MTLRPGIVAALVRCGTLAACGGDDAKGVLQEDDLPSVTKSSDITNVPWVAVCSEIKEAEASLIIGTKPEIVARSYILENDDHVSSIALGKSVNYGSLEAELDRVEGAIADCAAREPGEFTPLTGLDPGVAGYTETSATDEPRHGARVFAIQGDRLVVVGTRHEGDGDPKVDVVKLLPKALERAKDAPKD
jgi:hypothetical protein